MFKECKLKDDIFSILIIKHDLISTRTDYFTSCRQENCFDLSGPLLPLKHYPTRFQKTLIDYQQDVSKPVKQYFSSVDLRKRLTSFSQKTDNEERFQKILKKIEELITEINTNKFLKITEKENRQKPWDSTWWKSNVKSFQSLRFLNQYSSARSKREFHLQQTSLELKRMKKAPVKIRRNHGAQPILKMCPHPYASRGEAERIINHAAKLLLVTENYDVDAYDFTGTGMKIKPTAKKPKRYSVKSKSIKSLNKKSSSENTLNTIHKKSSVESISTANQKTNAFKIKKLIHGKDLLMTTDSGETNRVNPEDDGIFITKKSNDSSESYDNAYIPNEKPTRMVEENKKQCCMCKKATSVKPSIETSPVQKTLECPPPIFTKQSTDSHQSDATFATIPLKNNYEPVDISLPKRGAKVEGENVPMVEGWLKCGTSQDSKTEAITQDNFNYHENASNFNTKQIFEIKVITGDRIGASTNANVWLHMTGDLRAMKQSVELKKSSSHRRPFTRGNTDTFKIKSSRYLGRILSIQIGHDSDEAGSDWFLESVSVRDCRNQMTYFFPCSRWLSVRSDDKQTRVNILSQPCMYETKVMMSNIKYSDIGTQCSDLSDNNYPTAGLIFHQKKGKHHSKNVDTISDLVVEFSDLSYSETSASSMMSVRRNDRYTATDIFELYNPLLEDVTEEAIISVKENNQNFPIEQNNNYDEDFNTEFSMNENAEDSYSPNPISFCDEETV